MLATQIEVSDGTLHIINVGIEFFEQPDISVALDQSDPLVEGVDYVWSDLAVITFNATANTPGGFVPNGVEVILRRKSKEDDMYNVYDGGAPFSRSTLDENFQQLLFLSQEFSEGLGFDGLRNNLNMNGYKVTNLGDPTEPGDAVPLSYLSTSLQKTIRAPENMAALPGVGARQDKLLSFDSSGNPIAVAPVSGTATDLAILLASSAGAGNVGTPAGTVQTILDQHTMALGKFGDPTNAANGDAQIAVKKLAAGAGAVSRDQHDVNEEEVTLNDFTDIPDAIAWAMSTNNRRAIILPGGDLDMTGKQFLLPVNLNDPAKFGLVRPLYIRSKGGTRIFKNDAGTLFDVAGLVSDPLARFLDLFVSGIEFESDLNAGTVAFNVDQIYRLYVDHCTFRCVDYPFKNTVGNYAQTLRATNNSCHGAKAFASLDYGFDIKITENVIEHGTDGLIFTGASSTHALYNADLSGNVLEGLSDAAIVCGATQGVSICSNYMEENLGADFELGLSANAHLGLTIQGNWFQQPAARVTAGAVSINWGNISPRGAVSGGNNCINGNLHNFLTGSGFVDVQGDFVPVGKALYSGHTTLRDPARAAVGRAEFTEDSRKVISRDTTYVALDTGTCAVDFGLSALSVNVGGELIAPCKTIGVANPETFPGSYGSRKWAIGSEVMNINPLVGGGAGVQFIVAGWKCVTSGEGGGAGTDRWVEMRTYTGT